MQDRIAACTGSPSPYILSPKMPSAGGGVGSVALAGACQSVGGKNPTKKFMAHLLMKRVSERTS